MEMDPLAVVLPQFALDEALAENEARRDSEDVDREAAGRERVDREDADRARVTSSDERDRSGDEAQGGSQ